MKRFFSVSNIFACLSFVLALVFVILYATNVNSAGYFQGIKAGGVVAFAIVTMVLALAVIVISFLPVKGTLAKVLGIVASICKVLVPMFLVFGAMNLLGARLEGLGYIFFSNVDVAKEVATPENVASAGVAIAAIAVAYVGVIVSIVGAFFMPKVREAAVE